MLNKLWGAMIVIGIAVAAFQGKIGNVGTAAIDSSKEAVMLCITMLGVMSMWTGIMNVAKKAGLIDAMTRALRPVLRFLFPENIMPICELKGNQIATFFALLVG